MTKREELINELIKKEIRLCESLLQENITRERAEQLQRRIWLLQDRQVRAA